MSTNYFESLLKIESCLEEIECMLSRAISAEEVAKHLEKKNIEFDNATQIVSALDKEFIEKFPLIIKTVVCTETLIPSEIPVEIWKKKYRVRGEVWVVHKNDIDPFPSSPHAHNYDQNLVMHLGNGKMYRRRKYIATAKKKQFLDLRKKIDNVTLPTLEL